MTQYAIFDFDGTLVDSNGVFVRLCLDYMDSRGVPADHDFIRRAVTMSFPEFCAGLSRLAGGADAPAAVMDYAKRYVADFYGNCPLKPGVADYLERLAGRGTAMCVASATEEELIRPVLRRLGIEEQFAFVATVAQVGGVGKDRPDLFLAAARRFGETDSGRFTVFDDALAAVKSAKSVGMRTVGVLDDEDRDSWDGLQKTADLCIHSFRQLL